MSEEKTTTIVIHESTWRELNMRRRLGESMEDVISRLLKRQPIESSELTPEDKVTSGEKVKEK
jgi:predicted CopG family antitoxin